MTRWLVVTVVALVALMQIGIFSSAASGPAQDDRAGFRVIGYYSLRAAAAADLSTVPFDKLTHINLSFLNPDPGGDFTQDHSAVMPFIDAAHRSHVKVLVSIGGGGAHPYYHDLLKDESRPAFIERLVSTAMKYKVDGIDVDLEGRDIEEHYEVFVVELAKALRARGKLITSAIAGRKK